ncbi:hypothetical protein ACTFIW_008837 [Dictyostelium discoideum]
MYNNNNNNNNIIDDNDYDDDDDDYNYYNNNYDYNENLISNDTKKQKDLEKEPLSKSIAFITIGTLTLLYVIVELGAALYVGSLTLLSDGFHNLSDVVSLVIAWWAQKAAKRDSDNFMSYGWARAEILGGLTNGCFLLSMSLYVALEAIPRFIRPEPMESGLIFMIVAGSGLAINILGTIVFACTGMSHAHSHGGGGGHSHGGGGGHSHGGAEKEKKKEKHGHSHDGAEKEKKKEKHGHSHSTVATTTAVGINSEEHNHDDHDHHDHSEESHGHSHGGEKKKEKKHGHSHSHGGGAAEGININDDHHEHDHDHEGHHDHSEENHGHSHGGGPEKKKEKHGHGHSHDAEKKKEKHGHGHSHDGVEKKKKKKKSSGTCLGMDLNMFGVFLHFLGDAISSLFVLITGAVIHFTHGKWTEYIDPAVSLIIVIMIAATSAPLVKRCSMILLQKVPDDIDLDSIRYKIAKVEGVVSQHDLHVWQLVDGMTIASVHVGIEQGREFQPIASKLRKIFHKEGIHSTSIQPEFLPINSFTGGATSDPNFCIQNCVDDCEEEWCCKKSADRIRMRNLNSKNSNIVDINDI